MQQGLCQFLSVTSAASGGLQAGQAAKGGSKGLERGQEPHTGAVGQLRPGVHHGVEPLLFGGQAACATVANVTQGRSCLDFVASKVATDTTTGAK